MKSLSRDPQSASSSTDLVLRILERPGLVAAVRELPAPVLGKLIDRIGLEDAGDIVALASTAQLERIFDDDLWRAARPGGDETFRPERFVLWLRVMQEAGEAALVERLCELPQELLVLAVQRLVLVLDFDVLEEELRIEDEAAEALAHALDVSVIEEWEEFRVIARDPDTWDDVWGALLSLDRDHHDRLRAILEACCEMSTEFISGQGGLYQVLTAEERLDSDVAAARDDRRAAEGFVSPADARAFLDLARRGGGGDARDAITRAYFRGLRAEARDDREMPRASTPRGHDSALATDADARDLGALLREAEVIAPAAPVAGLLPAAQESAAAGPRLVGRLLEQAMTELRQRDPGLFAVRARELGYLINVWIAGGEHEGQRPRPVDALETVLEICEAGLRRLLGGAAPTAAQALRALTETPADLLFRRGLAGSRRG